MKNTVTVIYAESSLNLCNKVEGLSCRGKRWIGLFVSLGS
jgi:hypothetical protein